MAGIYEIIYEQSFTNSSVIQVNHNQNAYAVAVRILQGSVVNKELLDYIEYQQNNERNAIVIYLKQPASGRIQILGADYVRVYGSPELNKSLSNLFKGGDGSIDGYATTLSLDQTNNTVSVVSEQATGIQNSLDGYATQYALNIVGAKTQNIENALDGYIKSSQIGAAGGVPSLDSGGKIPSAQLPASSIPEVHVVAGQTERLALTVQEGDEAIQTDNGKHYIYDGSDWYERPDSGNITGPGSSTDNAIVRWDGTTGAVIKNSAVTIDNSGNIATSGTVDGRDLSSDGTKLDTIETNAKDDQTITAGTGLSGGGTGDVTISANFGTTSGTVTQGNDSRIPTQNENNALVGTNGSPSSSNKYVTNSDPRMTDARTPTAHASTHANGGSDELQHQSLDGSGTNTHAQIDTHIGNTSIHFEESDIDHSVIQNIGTNTHAQIDTHISNSGIHFTESSINHYNIQNIGSNTHTQIDSHISNTNNPHNTDIGNIGNGTLSELNSAITDATLDDSGDPRTPIAHASTHEDGGTDELTAQDLGSGAATSGKIMQTDGSGGWTLIDTPNSATVADIDYFDGYDYSGGTTITSAWVDVPINAIRIKNDPYIHSSPSAEITFDEEGIYTVWAKVTTNVTSGTNRSQCEMRVVFDDGSGYSEVPGTRGAMYARKIDEGSATAMSAFTITVEQGYKIKMQATVVSGSSTIGLLPNGSSILIARFKGIKGDRGPDGDNVIDIEDDGSSVSGTPHSTLNFTGAGVTVSDSGSGVANINIPGGSGASGKAFIPFGTTSINGTEYLKTSGGTSLGHKLTNDFFLKGFSILTDANNNNTYVVEKNGSVVSSVSFSNEQERLVTGLNVSYSAGDKVNVKAISSVADFNSPYDNDGYTIFLAHIDNDFTVAQRSIINSGQCIGINGRSHGATLGVTGKFNKAADFDGSNDYIEIPHHKDMDIQDATVEFWFYSDDINYDKALFSKDSTDYDTGGHLTIWQTGYDDIAIRSQSTNGEYNEEYTSANLSVNTWYHIAVVLGSGGIKVFLDGQLVLSDSNWEQGLNGNREPIVLGASTISSGNGIVTNLTDYFNGRICELRISSVRRYESNFTPQTAKFVDDGDTIGLWNFDETSGEIIKDSSSTSSCFTAKSSNSSFPTKETSIVKFGTASIKMNSSDNAWLEHIHNSCYEVSEVMIESWLYVYDTGDGRVFQKGTSSTEGGLEVWFENSNDHLEVTYYGDSTSRTIITANDSFPVNEWHHFAITINASQIEVYIDGDSVGSEALTSDFQNVWTNNKDDIYLAADENQTNYLKAYYDEIRISNVIRNIGNSDIEVSILVEMEEQ